MFEKEAEELIQKNIKLKRENTALRQEWEVL